MIIRYHILFDTYDGTFFSLFSSFWTYFLKVCDIYIKITHYDRFYFIRWIFVCDIPIGQINRTNTKETMKDYFDTNERQDLQLLYEFNYNTKLFQSITPTEEKSQIDAIGKRKNREFAIELKHRFINLGKYKSIMIEDYKFSGLMLEYIINHREPLYVNFLADGTVVIFNLNKLSTMPKMRITDIKSEGYDKMQCQERRYLLDIKDAVIYKDNNLIKTIGECKTTDYS